MTHFFFFNDTATTEIYTLSLHDALPILNLPQAVTAEKMPEHVQIAIDENMAVFYNDLEVSRSEEHTSELQSH